MRIVALLAATAIGGAFALPPIFGPSDDSCGAHEGLLRSAIGADELSLTYLDDPAAADLWDAIFARSDRGTSSFMCVPDDSLLLCQQGGVAYSQNGYRNPLVVLCPPWFELPDTAPCGPFERYPGRELPHNKVGVIVHELAHGVTMPDGGRVWDEDSDNKPVYGKNDVLKMAAGHAADPTRRATAHNADAYALFAMAIRSRFSDDCRGKEHDDVAVDYSCSRQYRFTAMAATAHLKPFKPDPRGCGRGLLDNLRGQCGWIMEWECSEITGPGIDASWKMPLRATDKCIRDAIWLSSGREGVSCRTDV
ncbi:MAG: hypothetical protein M1832_000701 [Thelocarpon impressellum]|nr:MAG: hypothetical protein M1832_000701 [Thelocarpon impressellum]